MKWKNLKFEQHSCVSNGVQCKMDFDNGEWCSIVGAVPSNNNATLYGDGICTFEIYSSSTKKTRNGVKCWLSKAQVLRHLNYLKNKESK